MKSDVSESLKEALKNDSFREAYNKLTDKQKEKLKERYSLSREVQEKFSQANTHSIKMLESIAVEGVKAESEEKGFTKFASKKSREFLLGRAFSYIIEGYYVGVRVNKFLKKGIDYSFFILLEIQTDKGKAYVDVRLDKENKKSFLVYTAHFFDRYNERLKLFSKDVTDVRSKTILSFVEHELCKNSHCSASSVKNETFTVNLAKGLGLGEEMSPSVAMVKTFISENEINRYQEILKDDLESDEEAFNLE